MIALRSAAAAVLAASALAAGCGVQYKESREIDVPHVADSSVKVTTDNGFITVTSSQYRTTVKIEAFIAAKSRERAKAVRIVAERTPTRTLVVRAEWPEGRRESSEGCSFQISLSDASSVDVSSSNGAIQVGGRCGPVSARTTNGSIAVRIAQARVDANTSNGAVTVTLTDENPGPVSLATSNGSVRLTVGSGFHGSLTAETDNGKVDLSGITEFTGGFSDRDRKRAEIAVRGLGHDSHLKTSNGSIYLASAKK